MPVKHRIRTTMKPNEVQEVLDGPYQDLCRWGLVLEEIKDDEPMPEPEFFSEPKSESSGTSSESEQEDSSEPKSESSGTSSESEHEDSSSESSGRKRRSRKTSVENQDQGTDENQ